MASGDLVEGTGIAGTPGGGVLTVQGPSGLFPFQVVGSNFIGYDAIYRQAARPYVNNNVFGAAGRKQFATLHHTGASTKTVKIWYVSYTIRSNTVAAIIYGDLHFITTAPATGNPAITPTPRSRGDAGSEAVALTLPTTAGTEGGLISTSAWSIGATGGAPVTNPPPVTPEVILHDWRNPQYAKPIILRAGQLEGVAITIDVDVATTVAVPYLRIIFSEE